MTTKRKVLLLQTRHIESISYLAHELAQAFPVERYQVSLVYLESGEPSVQDKLAHECLFLGMDKTDYKGLRLGARAKLGAFLSGRQFDVVIANMYKPIHLLMQLQHQLDASLCIGIIHAFGEFDRWGRRMWMRWHLQPHWRLVGVSPGVRDYLIAANCGLHSGNTLAINNAIDVAAVAAAALDKHAARQALGLPASGRIFGSVGRCVKGKRHLELLRAFHLALNQGQDIYLAIVGDGELRGELLAYVAEHQLQSRVYLPGYVAQAVRYLAAFDVFVFPSESEGFSIALLEAMALSLPTLVNDIAALAGVVAGSACVVNCAHSQSLAAALEHYGNMSETELLEQGRDNFARASSQFNIEGFRASYLRLVEDHFNQAAGIAS